MLRQCFGEAYPLLSAYDDLTWPPPWPDLLSAIVEQVTTPIVGAKWEGDWMAGEVPVRTTML